jgi:hypothetical protein
MPSWVVPTVAAEYWGVPVEQVMADVAGGRIISRTEGGFLFVDVDPAREIAAAPAVAAARPAYRRPLAWTPTTHLTPEPVVTAAERDALLASADDMKPRDRDAFAEEEPAPVALTADDIPDWEQVRARVSRTRRPPVCSAA